MIARLPELKFIEPDRLPAGRVGLRDEKSGKGLLT